ATEPRRRLLGARVQRPRIRALSPRARTRPAARPRHDPTRRSRASAELDRPSEAVEELAVDRSAPGDREGHPRGRSVGPPRDRRSRMTTDRDYRRVDPKHLVRTSYNAISHAYRGDTISRDRGYFRWLDALRPHLRDRARVLELGCGCGVPVAQELAATCDVTGVDISDVQVERARALVPSARFV